jgi:redox-sensitive bicupin YhaK (pirin superfamily)
MRKVLGIYSAPRPHWVGDGFPVRSLFSQTSHGEHVSPFLLLDYAGPAEFAPTDTPRGVGTHPHRGFETVTIVYKGEVEHRDSTGKGGIIGPGDVQWMTAARGILHKEFHSQAFTRSGGTLEMVQLRDIPAVALPNGSGTLRVIAGEHDGRRGPARSFTPINLWDLRLNRGGAASLTLPEGHTVMVAVLKGTVQINGDAIAREAQLVLFDREGGEIALEANGDASLLILSGEPINEPVVMHGPFVMNTAEEIRQAMVDFQNGRFGEIAA